MYRYVTAENWSDRMLKMAWVGQEVEQGTFFGGEGEYIRMKT
jgi:hypothetical protein